VEISYSFYNQLFHNKVFLRSFYVLTIWVCPFWQKDFGAKAAHKMLVKLTLGGNFILFYDRSLHNWQNKLVHFENYMGACMQLAMVMLILLRAKNVFEIDHRCINLIKLFIHNKMMFQNKLGCFPWQVFSD
jgi:hypothetical protein